MSRTKDYVIDAYGWEAFDNIEDLGAEGGHEL